MNIEHFIAKRIAVTNTGSFTKVIIRIAMAAIAVSLTVMILTTAIISGFKREISAIRYLDFGGVLHVTDNNINRNFELIPISKDEKFYDEIRDIKQLEYQAEAKILGFALKDNVVDKKTYSGVKGVHPYIILPGLLSSKRNFHGVLLKGVDEAYDFDQNGSIY